MIKPYRRKYPFICLILLLTMCMWQNCHANEKTQAIIFNCDGVLVDTGYLKYEAWKESLKPYHIKNYLPLVGHFSLTIAQRIASQYHARFSIAGLIKQKMKFTIVVKQKVSLPFRQGFNF